MFIIYSEYYAIFLIWSLLTSTTARNSCANSRVKHFFTLDISPFTSFLSLTEASRTLIHISLIWLSTAVYSLFTFIILVKRYYSLLVWVHANHRLVIILVILLLIIEVIRLQDLRYLYEAPTDFFRPRIFSHWLALRLHFCHPLLHIIFFNMW